jgi:hypothetical protein
MFYKFSAWLKSWEPFRYKLQRWILDIPNRAPLSILESRAEGSQKYTSEGWEFQTGHISHAEYNKLAEVFIKCDNQFFYGVSFKFLISLFRNLKVFEKKSEEEKKLYDKSNYRRKVNKKCCGIGLKEFISTVLEYQPSDMSQQDWIEQVMDEMTQLQDHHKRWEERYIPLRMELIKLYSPLKNLKKEYIANLLIDNPFINVKEIGKHFISIYLNRKIMFGKKLSTCNF